MNIIGIDPGSALGIAVVDIDTDKFNIIDTFVVDLPSIINQIKTSRLTPMSPSLAKQLAIRKILEDLSRYSPDGIACEDVYVHNRYPKAVLSISSIVTILDYLVYQMYGFQLLRIHNSIIKKNCDSSSKDGVKNFLITNPNIVFPSTKDKTSLTEHEYDAIGTVYAAVQMFRVS